ncbi:MAG: LacI family DNA-binding transcriptional regulator [Verrucomicrobiae bacterium]
MDIKTIAKRAGFSVGTVSMALNDNQLVKASTREKVRAIAVEMGYVPNIIAQIVSSRHNRAVGIVLPNATPDFFGRALYGIMRQFEKADQHAFSVYGQDRPDNELYYLRIFTQLRLRGLIMSPCPGSQALPQIQRLIENGTRVVFLDRAIPGVAADFIGINYVEAARIATERLIEAGHRRIGAVVGAPLFSSTTERMDGFRRALKGADIAFDEKLVLRLDYENDFNHDRIDAINQASLRSFLAEHQPTALFLAMDGNVPALQHVCSELGWRIPEHLNIVGFDDPTPQFTRRNDWIHVSCPIGDVGLLAGKTMIERLKHPEASPVRRRLDAQVWPDATCGPRKPPRARK